jgi:SAM-dependent methyltransferase
MKRLMRLSLPFVKEGEYCWIADLPRDKHWQSDTQEYPRRSNLLLFEDELEIGPSHALHENIREIGRGRFSHWDNQLYFSSSDNSNPEINGRQYMVVIDDDDIEDNMVDFVGQNESRLLSAIQANVNQNGSALYNLLLLYRSITHMAREVGLSLKGKSVLEFGSDPLPGLPLIMLLNGVNTYYANNKIPINNRISESYVKLIYAILSGVLPENPPSLDAVGRFISNQQFELSSEKLINLSPLTAESISLSDESVDMIFSFSVLEHVGDPRTVISNMYRLLKPGAIMIANIDLRDHRDFSKPLGFLTYTKHQYLELVERGEIGENRWRATDFHKCFTEAGFNVLSQRYKDTNFALTSGGSTNAFETILQPFGAGLRYSVDTVTPWVTEKMRSTFDMSFSTYSLADLSVMVMSVILKKPE